MDNQKTYKKIKSLEFDLMVYPNSRQQILDNAGKYFYIDGEKHWFVVAEDGGCALFDKNCKIDDLSKIKTIINGMIRKDIKSINIPDSVEKIGLYAFIDCASLTSINIPDSVEIIGAGAFANCTSLKSINIPDSVEIIGNSAFFNCESLESINIPDSVKSIEKNVFSYCKSLKSINIPDSVERIEDGAFAVCTSLININIPSSVESIGHRAFYKCEFLEKVVFKGKTLEEVELMANYPWGIEDESIIEVEL